jgi:hypothetical protein
VCVCVCVCVCVITHMNVRIIDHLFNNHHHVRHTIDGFVALTVGSAVPVCRFNVTVVRKLACVQDVMCEVWSAMRKRACVQDDTTSRVECRAWCAMRKRAVVCAGCHVWSAEVECSEETDM